MRVTTEALASVNKELTPIQRPNTAESTTNAASVKAISSDLKGGNIWPVIEQIRGRCLQGWFFHSPVRVYPDVWQGWHMKSSNNRLKPLQITN
jgi:hypothetical protein